MTDHLDQFFDVHSPGNTEENTIYFFRRFLECFSKNHKTGVIMIGIGKIIKNKELPEQFYKTIEFAFRVIDPKEALPPNDMITGKITLNGYKVTPIQISHFHPDTFIMALLLKNDLKSYFG